MGTHQRPPLYQGIVRGCGEEYMIVEIAPDVHGTPGLRIVYIGRKLDCRIEYKRRYGEAFVWPEPMFKVVGPDGSGSKGT